MPFVKGHQTNVGKSRIQLKTIINKTTDDKFREIIASSRSPTEAIRKLGYKGSKNTKILDERLKQLCIDTSHFNSRGLGVAKKPDSELRSTFGNQKGSMRRPTKQLRNILRHVRRPYICEWCQCEKMELEKDGEWMWNGVPVQLEVNHVLGVGFEGCNAVENLQYLCPNCHRQHSYFSRLK